MKVIQVVNPGPASTLKIQEQAEPNVLEGEVLIKVAASGVNRADLLQRSGKYPPPPGVSEILGLEVSGTIERIGPSVSRWAVGEEVCALLAGGGYAEKVVVPAGQVMHLPAGLPLREGAAIPEAFLTAYVNLVKEAELCSGERVLIHGGASGVGTAAIQIARCLGAEVACTVGSDSKVEACRKLGAACVVNYKTQDFRAVVNQWSSEGINVILDIVGRDYMERNIGLLAPRGRLVCIATMSGAKAEIDIGVVMRKRLKIIGSVLRGRSVVEKSLLIGEFSEKFLPLFETKKLQPIVERIFPMPQVEEAHAELRASAHVGKLLLVGW